MPQFDRWDEGYERPERDRSLEQPVWGTPPAAPESGGAAPEQPDYGTFEFPSYGGSSSPYYNFGEVPEFDAPDFSVPTFEAAQNEPGYQFRLDAGRKALERGAAARGVLRTGGTLKDILEYGQNFGAQEYSNVFNRALQAYGAQYQAAKDEYAPYLAQYQNQFGAEQSRAMAEFQRQMELYNANLENTRFQEALLNGVLQTPAPTFPGSM